MADGDHTTSGYSIRDKKVINCLRFLAVDAIEKANSGHPGMPMGAASMAFTLWDKFLRHDPGDPLWPDRDRFVLSAGHGSMLLYGLLHLSGYNLPLEEIKNFRQWGSMTPGHPEYGHAPGVETTTGPLGQGFGNAVGMAIAERHLADRFNKPDFPVVDHFTYVIAGDGCIMEGVCQEAASLAGHLGLGRLIVLYDDNHITIDGPTDLAFTEDVVRRFDAYGWHTLSVDNGNDCGKIASAIAAAREETSRPSLIAIRTHIAYGAPNKQDTSGAHGSPLGEEEIALAKKNLDWPLKPDFLIPDEAREYTARSLARGREIHDQWLSTFDEYQKAFPGEARAFLDALDGNLPDGWESHLPRFDQAMATRAASGQVINAVADVLPQLIGGSADLAPSNNTLIKSSTDLAADNPGGRNIRFGVREHAMGAIINGLSLHKGVIPYGGTFLVFSDYMRPAVRLAALMKIRSIFVYTHDSIGVGEDGPTHQPVEHIAALRTIPGLTVIRPADANEVTGAWEFALREKDGPVALILTRQSLPLLDMPPETVADRVTKGAYTVFGDENAAPDLIMIASGSEVSLAIKAAKILLAEGHGVRVVSMPSWELFSEQAPEYRDRILPPGVKRMSIEAQVTLGWERWTGSSERCYGIDRFGASAPGKVLFEKYGFTAEKVAALGRDILDS